MFDGLVNLFNRTKRNQAVFKSKCLTKSDYSHLLGQFTRRSPEDSEVGPQRRFGWDNVCNCGRPVYLANEQCQECQRDDLAFAEGRGDGPPDSRPDTHAEHVFQYHGDDGWQRPDHDYWMFA